LMEHRSVSCKSLPTSIAYIIVTLQRSRATAGRLRRSPAHARRPHTPGRQPLPFLIEDVTPRSLRVPGGRAAEHPNGATGISRLELAAADTEMAARDLAALLGAPDAHGGPFRLGNSTLTQVTARRRLDASGPRPPAIWLANREGVEQGGELDRRFSEGARILLPRRPFTG
jgi:hypothetical protein